MLPPLRKGNRRERMDGTAINPQTTIEPAALVANAPGRVRPARGVALAIGWLLLIGAAVSGAVYGVQLRRWAWESTVRIRFEWDIRNGFNQGSLVTSAADARAAAEHRPADWHDFFTAYVHTYADVVGRSRDGNYGLDYAPARLLVMSLWVKHLRDQHPPITDWNPAYATSEPLLRFNTVCEAVAAVAMGALLRHWRRARHGWRILPRWKSPWCEWPPLFGALAVWFNPALIWNAHVWPQWDGWLIPFALLGVLAASKNRWTLAGFLLLAGASLKGQVLMVLPVVLLWPILAGRPMAAVRMVIGAALFAALMALPWMLQTYTAVVWFVVAMTMAVGLVVLARWRYGLDRFDLLMLLIAAIVITPATLRADYSAVYVLAPLLLVLTAVLPRFAPRGWRGPLVAAQFATAVFLAGFAFEGQFQWFEVGYVYPTRHYPTMTVSGSNLPMLLGQVFNWRLHSPVALPYLEEMPMRSFLIWLFAVLIALCSLGVAMHARRRNPRVLMALATPWVLMFTVLPQMHERYLLWGAVMLCAGFGISVGDALLATAVTFFAWADMASGTLPRDSSLLPSLTKLVGGMSPGAAWGLMMVSLVCLYSSIVPERGWRFGFSKWNSLVAAARRWVVAGAARFAGRRSSISSDEAEPVATEA